MAHNAAANDHTMVPNVAPDSLPQPQTVLQQLWEQQSAQYFSYWLPERVSQIPAHNMSAQQSCLAYPSSTYYKNQPMQPVPQSAQCGSSSNWSYPTHGIAPYQHPYPYSSHYSHATTMPAYSASQHSYYTSFNNTPNYYPPYHGALITSSCQGGIDFRPWGVQSHYGWPGSHHGSWEPSLSYGVYCGGNWTDSDGAIDPHLVCSKNGHSEHAQRASSQGRDNYRPTYIDSSPRYDRSTNPYQQYPRRVLVAGKVGPTGNSRRPWRPMSPLSTYLPQLQQLAIGNTEAPALSNPLELTLATSSMICCQASDILLLDTESALTSCQSLGASDHESNVTAQRPQELPFGPRHVLANDTDQELGGTTVVVTRRLSKPNVQIDQPKLMASANSTIEVAPGASDPVKLHTDDEPGSSRTLPESVGRVQTSPTKDAELSQANLSIELAQTYLAENKKPDRLETAAEKALVRKSVAAEAVCTHFPIQDTSETSAEVVDYTQPAVDGIAVEFSETANTNKKPDAIGLLSAEVVAKRAQAIRYEVMGTTTDASAVASSSNPIASESVDHIPSRKHSRPRNRKQKRATINIDKTRPSRLILSRTKNQDGDVSQPSPSTTDSSNTSPPTKRIKEESVTSPGLGRRLNPGSVPRANAWLNFATIIKQDDDMLKAKLSDERERERKAGNKFQPEIKETYKDQKGKAETIVHEKVGAPAAAKTETSAELAAKKEDSDGGESGGGIKLEPEISSDMELKTE